MILNRRRNDAVMFLGKQVAAFTLIELLVVIAIIIVLFLTTMPAIHSMGGKNIDSATVQLMSTIRLARQYAVIHRKNVWIVFPDLRSSPYATSDDLKKVLRAYAVITTNSVDRRYEYVTDWKMLPKSVCFLTNTIAQGTNSVFINSLFRLPFPNDAGAPKSLAAVMFKSNGKPYLYNGIDNWNNGELLVPLTTTKYYEEVAGGGTLFVADRNGITNQVRIKSTTGQIDLRR